MTTPTEIVKQEPQEQRLAPVVKDSMSAALATQAQTEVLASYKMALERPRDLDNMRFRLLQACGKSFFAATALYVVPRGGKEIVGLSVRFAEECLRYYGNVRTTRMVTYDDPDERRVKVRVMDLETNTVLEEDFAIEKTIERKELKRGQVARRTRTNSYGDTVFLVEATEEELAQKESSKAARVWRNLVLKLMPSWILDEARGAVNDTRKAEVKKDPDAVRRKVFDGFAGRGVLPDALKEYLGRPEIGQPTEDELLELSGLLSALREGDVTWEEALAQKMALRVPGEEETKAAAASAVEQLRTRGAAARAAVTQKETPPAKEEPPAEAQVEEPPPPTDEEYQAPPDDEDAIKGMRSTLSKVETELDLQGAMQMLKQFPEGGRVRTELKGDIMQAQSRARRGPSPRRR